MPRAVPRVNNFHPLLIASLCRDPRPARGQPAHRPPRRLTGVRLTLVGFFFYLQEIENRATVQFFYLSSSR